MKIRQTGNLRGFKDPAGHVLLDTGGKAGPLSRELKLESNKLSYFSQAMEIKKYIPTDLLKPYIKAYMVIESKNGTVNRILPGTSLVMAFRLKGKITFQKDEIENKLPVSAIAGLRKSSRLINYSKQSATFLVIFDEGGAAAFFDEPLHDFFGLHISLDSLIPRSKLNEIQEQLAGAKNNRRRIAIVEEFLLSQLQGYQSDQLISHSIKKIKSAKGDLRINDLVTELPISRDPFEKKFRRLTGTSPKQFSGIVRLRNVIDNYSQEKSLTEIAHAAGYFDQSHFIKDFKSFTGQTPSDFFESPSFW